LACLIEGGDAVPNPKNLYDAQLALRQCNKN
jgi:hypothetical protein